MNDQYISIKEFANNVGKTPQAIYQRIGKDLRPFVKEVAKGNKTEKHIDIKALLLFESKPDIQVVGNMVEKELDGAFKENGKGVTGGLESTLQEAFKVIAEQITVKDKQIEAKDKQIEIKDQQIADLNERLREAQELNRNNQVLLHGEQRITNQVLIGESPEEEIEKKKKGFLKWLLNR